MNLGIYTGHCLYIKDLASSDCEQRSDYHDHCKAQLAKMNWKKGRDLCSCKTVSTLNENKGTGLNCDTA